MKLTHATMTALECTGATGTDSKRIDAAAHSPVHATRVRCLVLNDRCSVNKAFTNRPSFEGNRSVNQDNSNRQSRRRILWA